jgi:hypothetical protein
VPQYDVVESGTWLGRVDLAWPEMVRDDERYEGLVPAGWRVIRLSAADLREMEAVVARIALEPGAPFLAG